MHMLLSPAPSGALSHLHQLPPGKSLLWFCFLLSGLILIPKLILVLEVYGSEQYFWAKSSQTRSPASCGSFAVTCVSLHDSVLTRPCPILPRQMDSNSIRALSEGNHGADLCEFLSQGPSARQGQAKGAWLAVRKPSRICWTVWGSASEMKSMASRLREVILPLCSIWWGHIQTVMSSIGLPCSKKDRSPRRSTVKGHKDN